MGTGEPVRLLFRRTRRGARFGGRRCGLIDHGLLQSRSPDPSLRRRSGGRRPAGRGGPHDGGDGGMGEGPPGGGRGSGHLREFGRSTGGWCRGLSLDTLRRMAGPGPGGGHRRPGGPTLPDPAGVAWCRSPVGTTAVGLSPLEAILTNDGPGQAKFFGWQEPFPDWKGVAARQVDAEAIADGLCTRDVERLLPPAERRSFAEAVTAAVAVLKQ
jgi:hypothetical protein